MGFLYFFSSSPSGSWEIQYLRRCFGLFWGTFADSFGAFIQLNRSQSGKEVLLCHGARGGLHPCCYWSWCLEVFVWKFFAMAWVYKDPQQRRNAWAKPVGQAKTPPPHTRCLDSPGVCWYSGWGFHCGMAGYSCRVFSLGTQWNTAGIWSQHYKRLPTVMLPFEYAWWAFPPANRCAKCISVARHTKPRNFNTADIATIPTMHRGTNCFRWQRVSANTVVSDIVSHTWHNFGHYIDNH